MAVEPTLGNPVAPPSGPPTESASGGSLMRRLVAAATVAYAAAIVAIWLWMYLAGDRRPLATLFLFGPRWICALPLALLVPAVAIWSRRLWWLLAASGSAAGRAGCCRPAACFSWVRCLFSNSTWTRATGRLRCA